MSNWSNLKGPIGRNEFPFRLWEMYECGEFDNLDELAIGVEAAWTMAEWPELGLARQDWWAMFKDVGYLVESVRSSCPIEPVRLFRGASFNRRRGSSWSQDPDVAAWFARRSKTDVWTTLAPPHRLLAYFDETRREQEFVINPKSLRIGLASPRVMRRAKQALEAMPSYRARNDRYH